MGWMVPISLLSIIIYSMTNQVSQLFGHDRIRAQVKTHRYETSVGPDGGFEQGQVNESVGEDRQVGNFKAFILEDTA